MKVLKIISAALCVCTLMLCAGVVGYETVKMRRTAPQEPAEEERAPAAVGRTAEAAEPVTGVGDVRETREAEYYVVRMNGGRLGVFIRRGDTEEFFYNTEVDLYSLGEQDKALLARGVVLHTKEELASFLEDFTG